MWNSYKFKLFLIVSVIIFQLIVVFIILTDNFDKKSIFLSVCLLTGIIYPIERLLKLKRGVVGGWKSFDNNTQSK
jgi:hypothetical protein